MFEIYVTNPETLVTTLFGRYADQDLANEIAMRHRDLTGAWVTVYPAEQ